MGQLGAIALFGKIAFYGDAGSFDADVVGVEDVKVGDRFHGGRPGIR
jgi:hypothetical protein